MIYNSIEELILIICISLFILAIALLMIIVGQHNWQEPRWKFIFKKILDSLFSACPYLVFIFVRGLRVKFNNQQYGNQGFLAFYLFFLTIPNIFTVLSFITEVSGWSIKIRDRKTYIFIILSNYITLLFMFTAINYGMYCLIPEGYTFSTELGFWEIAFEFLYYTFSLMLTFSGGKIVASCVVTKFLEMIEIAVSFIFVGYLLIVLLEKMIIQTNEKRTEIIEKRKPTRRLPYKCRCNRSQTGHVHCRKNARSASSTPAIKKKAQPQG